MREAKNMTELINETLAQLIPHPIKLIKNLI